MLDLTGSIQNLRDGSLAQRQRAAHTLGLSQTPQAVVLLLEALQTERSRSVRWVIVEALGHLRAPDALELLERILNDEDEHGHVRFQAAQAIERITGQALLKPSFDPKNNKLFATPLEAVRRPDDMPESDIIIRRAPQPESVTPPQAKTQQSGLLRRIEGPESATPPQAKTQQTSLLRRIEGTPWAEPVKPPQAKTQQTGLLRRLERAPQPEPVTPPQEESLDLNLDDFPEFLWIENDSPALPAVSHRPPLLDLVHRLINPWISFRAAAVLARRLEQRQGGVDKIPLIDFDLLNRARTESKAAQLEWSDKAKRNPFLGRQFYENRIAEEQMKLIRYEQQLQVEAVKPHILPQVQAKVDRSRLNYGDRQQARTRVEELFNETLAEKHIILPHAEHQRLLEDIVAEILGFGPLEPLLADEGITDIMVNGPKNIFVEKKGTITRAPVTFEDDDHVLRILDRILAPLGHHVDRSSPYVNARLPDGSRISAVIPPISLVGPTITIRRFFKQPLTYEHLIRFGSATKEIVEFMRACIIARLNVVVSGGRGSGKTTLLNVLCGFIPNDERIITIEQGAELQLRQEHVVTLEARPPDREGRGGVTFEDLIELAMTMRPDRLVAETLRGGEAYYLLQAMHTGFDGTMAVVHSASPSDTVSELERLCQMAHPSPSAEVIRPLIAASIDLIVHLERLRDGTRKVVRITEVQGIDRGMITMADIFEYEQTGVEGGKVIGRIRPTGIRPKFTDRIEAAGIYLPASVFGIGQKY